MAVQQTEGSPYIIQLRAAERRILSAALGEVNGNPRLAAAMLGMTDDFLQRRLRLYGIPPCEGAPRIFPPDEAVPWVYRDDGTEYARRMNEADKSIINFALEGAGGNITRAASALGISQPATNLRVIKYRLGKHAPGYHGKGRSRRRRQAAPSPATQPPSSGQEGPT